LRPGYRRYDMDYPGDRGAYIKMVKASLRTFDGQEYAIVDERQSVECFRCGICCMGYHPQLSEAEVERMAGHLGISTHDFIAKYVQVTQIGYLLRQTKTGCVFLTWEKDAPKSLCSVHPFRPDACRNWEPTLFRRECKAGLTKIQKDSGIMLVSEIYETQEELERFCAALRQPR